jgi:hypothetical protein
MWVAGAGALQAHGPMCQLPAPTTRHDRQGAGEPIQLPHLPHLPTACEAAHPHDPVNLLLAAHMQANGWVVRQLIDRYRVEACGYGSVLFGSSIA